MRVRYKADRHPVASIDGGGGGHLTDGAAYEVIEVTTERDRTLLRIRSNDGTPALFDSRGFVVIDDSIPSDWRIELSDGSATVGPMEFLRPGFWESFFDRDAMAVQLFEARQETTSWRQLAESEYAQVWDEFQERFAFQTGTTADKWPAIREPRDSLTIDLSPVFANEGPLFAAGERAVNEEALRAFVWRLGDIEMLALDWQHPAYWFLPHRFALSSNTDWPVPVFPNGDYYGFFSQDFAIGTFGHPWEQSLCVIGQPLVESLGRCLAGWLPVIRQGGVAASS